MNQNKILYISDLDGTLLNSRAELSEYTACGINKLISNRMNFTIATARTPVSVFSMFDNFEKVRLSAPLILMNGVLIYDPEKKEYIQKHILHGDKTTKIIEAMRECGQSGMMYVFRGGEVHTYYETIENPALRDFVDERVLKYNKKFSQTNNFSDITDSIIYFCFRDNLENITRLYMRLSQIDSITVSKFSDIYSSGLWYLEVCDSAASKQSGVKFLRGYKGYEKIIGFGDNLNDIPLFYSCDECYAVENAREELKKIATGVIGNHNDDGVLKWLENNT